MQELINTKPLVEYLRSLEDAHRARLQGLPVEPLEDDAEPQAIIDRVNEVIENLRQQRQAEASVLVKAPTDDGGISDTIKEVKAAQEAWSPKNIHAADGITVTQDPAGVTIGKGPEAVQHQIFPFDDVIFCDRVGMINSESGGVNHADDDSMTNNLADSATPHTQKLIVHTETSFGAGTASLTVPVYLNWTGSTPLAPVETKQVVVKGITTADYDIDTVTWDSWASAGPPVSAAMGQGGNILEYNGFTQGSLEDAPLVAGGNRPYFLIVVPAGKYFGFELSVTAAATGDYTTWEQTNTVSIGNSWVHQA